MGGWYRRVQEAIPVDCCRGCAGANLVCVGSIQGGNLYECRDCGLTTREETRDKAFPCPYCGGQCVKDGKCKARGGTKAQRYLCRSCGHHSSGLYPATRLEDLGGYLYRTAFGLDLGARVGLEAFCQRFGMRETEAVRAVFRASRFAALSLPERSEFLARVAARDGGSYAEPVCSAAAIAAGLPVGDVSAEVQGLPDARSAVSRSRCAGRLVAEMCGERSVDLVAQVSVALDRTAMAGLLRAMTFLETRNRQTAARFLLTDAVERFGAFVVLPELQGVKPGAV